MILLRRLQATLPLLLLVIAAGCQSPAEPDTSLTVTLTPGESVVYGRLTVRFIGVSEDSRCPADALCIQQGDATFTVDARVGSASARYDLRINDEQRRRVVHRGYTIEADELTPYPFTTNPIEPDEYRLTVTMDR